VVWGGTGAVIAVPELWAAVDSDSTPWPTISGTVGYLEYWHPWVAVIVIGVLVWAAYYSVVYRARPVGEDPDRTAGGRATLPWIRLKPSLSNRWRLILAACYYVVALAVVSGGCILVKSVRPDDKYLLGEVLYGSIGAFCVVIPSVVGLVMHDDVPFPTLFATIQNLTKLVRPVAILIAAGITVLLVHLALYPWPDNIPALQKLPRGPALNENVKERFQPSPYSP
jgi:hypothetical protein